MNTINEPLKDPMLSKHRVKLTRKFAALEL